MGDGKCKGCGRVCCDLSWQIFLIIIQICGIVLSICTVVDCRFYVVTYMWGNGVPPVPPPNVTGLGLFAYEVSFPGEEPTCKRYIGSSIEYAVDDPMQAGGAFGAVALFLAFIGLCVTVFTLFLLCCLEMKGMKWIVGIFFIVSMICQGLTFLFVATDVCWKYNEEIGAQPQCNIGRSAGFSIGAICLYLWAGVQSCAMSWPEKAIGKERCCRACCKDEDVEVKEEADEEQQEADEEEEKGGGVEEKPEAPPEEDPNAAAAAAAGAAGGAAVAAAVAEEEEKEEVEEGDNKDEEMAEADKEETKEDDQESTKSEKSDFSEDNADDDSSFEEDDDEDEDDEEDKMTNEDDQELKNVGSA